MKQLLKRSRFLVKIGLTSLVASSATLVHASAFQIWEQNGAGTGMYHAGGAAIANDASTVFYNPAGLTRIHKLNMAGGAVAIPTSMRFEGSVTNDINHNKQTGSVNGGGFHADGNIAPFGYMAAPFNDHITLGFGVATPFGLTTNYAQDSIAAPSATKTRMKDLDFMPSVGIKINDNWSVGLGADINHLDGEFDNDTSIAGLVDFRSKNSGDALGYGFHAGVLYEPNQHTRVGLTYHSQVHYDLEGTSLSFIDGNKRGDSTDLKSSVTFPAFTMLSVYQDFTSKWSGMASATYTQWHVFDNLKLQNVVNPNPLAGKKIINVDIKQHFHNTFNLAIGTQYQINHMWTIKGGAGYDMTPTDNDDRNLRLPDASRVAASIGTHLQVNQHIGFDLGYTHVFFHDTGIDKSEDIGPNTVSTKGEVHSAADVIGFQVTWSL